MENERCSIGGESLYFTDKKLVRIISYTKVVVHCVMESTVSYFCS